MIYLNNEFDKKGLLNKLAKPDSDSFPLFSRAVEQAFLCAKRRETFFTDFFDPVSLSSLVGVLSSEKSLHIKIGFFGGYEGAERCIVCFTGSSEEIEHGDYPIIPLEIKYNRKFSRELSHRDFLGSILGLGIVRGKVGDIVIEEDKATAFIHSDIASFVEVNLEKVGKTAVSVKRTEFEGVALQEKEESRITVSSLRLDNVISAAFKLSRSSALELIEGEKVFLNFSVSSKASKLVCQGDMVTLRGKGRIKISEILGTSKKGKQILSILKY